MKKLGPFIGLAAILLVILGMGACQYNSLVSANENVEGKWAQVENVLQRRADLIPNLVETVKGFAAHETEVFSSIAQARSQLLSARGPEEAAEANQNVSSALGRLLAIGERYPELKSNQNFLELQRELAGTENRISVERKRYNEAVQDYNSMIKRFPKNLFAGMFGFDAKEYFEAEDGAEQAPEVQFN